MAVAFLSAQRSKDPNKQVTSALACLKEVISRSPAIHIWALEVMGLQEAREWREESKQCLLALKKQC